MLYVTDKMIQLSGVVIPGQVKKIEITQAATIDEVQNDNNVTLGYQPTGYELAKISVEITLEPTQEQTFLEQLATIQLLFRPVGQTDYIPCICWGRNALFAAGLNVGSKIKIDGRIQSRKYNKVIDGIAHTLTAYEVSASGITRESGKMIYG